MMTPSPKAGCATSSPTLRPNSCEFAGAGVLRDRIADCLQRIVAQRLVPKRDGSGLVLAVEVLVVTGTVRESLKRPENNPSLKELMEKGVTPYGMQTFDMHLRQLAAQGVVAKEIAKSASTF